MSLAQTSQRSACFEALRASLKLMRITAPFASSISFSQLSQTRTVLRAKAPPWWAGGFRPAYPIGGRKSRSFTGRANSPRAQQAEECLLLWLELGITRGDNAQMAGSEIVKCASLEVLLDHRRTDVRRSANGRGIPELLGDRTADRGDDLFPSGLGLRRSVLGEADRGEQRPAPGAEILHCEVLAEVRLH